VIAYGLDMVATLLGTGRYLAVHPESVLTFPTKHPFIRKLPIELPIVSGPIGIVTAKDRTPSPATQLFIDCARDVATPLGKVRRRAAQPV
jgi:DNA-binding transcriptional LysR family regulator